mmetsp:Transcript_14451/g.21615  ORF Transcript_14451/g.21615 Transcript_14451/m.21615 type:complete len:324 (+) Transcript_14451:157-1128(+)|eukprot:CAMPEP_0201555062 /NCGR_PEP_ID=MMETSP0173_2-20130828/46224_1 /ASSEMBLY_ACC=CAM_ASM_000268 /TAXON_ID=218659 /ORGANISM="Vexillifera sp., Strain DIVA3 564/2" /LENGTH=323 /DNA_ID=CAMNT_0047966663 /DNA_START=164 /DNA_END=1135 /DNA_ORIENTATION=-
MSATKEDSYLTKLAQTCAKEGCWGTLYLEADKCDKKRLTATGVQSVFEALASKEKSPANGIKVSGYFDESKPSLDAIGEYLARAPVKRLQFEHSDLHGETAALLFKAVGNSSSMKELNVKRCGLDDTAAKHLAEMIESTTSLKKLLLRNNTFTAVGSKLIAAALAKNSSIKVVDLSVYVNESGSSYDSDDDHFQMGDDGALAFAECLPSSAITKLKLNSHKISDIGGEALAKVGGKLREIGLGGNRHTDKTFTAWAETWKGSDTLECFDLQSKHITDEGLKAWVDAARAQDDPNLEMLELGDTIHDEAMTELFQVLGVDSSSD